MSSAVTTFLDGAGEQEDSDATHSDEVAGSAGEPDGDEAWSAAWAGWAGQRSCIACLRQGDRMARLLRREPLPPELSDAWATEWRLRVCACISALVFERRWPTLEAIRQSLLEHDMQGAAVDAVLWLCAHDAGSFVLMLRADLHCCIFLQGAPPAALDASWPEERAFDAEPSSELGRKLKTRVRQWVHRNGPPGAFALPACGSGLETSPAGADAYAASSAALPEGITTMMVRNLPLGITQEQLIAELDGGPFREAYACCYVPPSFGDKSKRGYAFVHLKSPEAAQAFAESWHGKRPFNIPSTEPGINVAVATRQGAIPTRRRKAQAERMLRAREPALRTAAAAEGGQQRRPKGQDGG